LFRNGGIAAKTPRDVCLSDFCATHEEAPLHYQDFEERFFFAPKPPMRFRSVQDLDAAQHKSITHDPTPSFAS